MLVPLFENGKGDGGAVSGLDRVILGVNHQFLYQEAMTDAVAHTKTLAILAENPEVEALDCWVWAAHSREELAILRSCGKQIHYNIGDRIGEVPVFPATADAGERAYALEILKRETEFAVESGAVKIVFGSGRDVLEGRDEAKKRFEEFVLRWSEWIPKDVWLTLEPTDRDVDKHFLFGGMEETCQTVRSIRKAGMDRMGILLDMGHIPIMHETPESAAAAGGALLEHIHLGNCVLRSKEDPYYGDKHPCWGYAGGEYDEKDGEVFLRELLRCGYFTKGRDRTVSFEMRPLMGKTPEESVTYLVNWFRNVYKLERLGKTPVCG